MEGGGFARSVWQRGGSAWKEGASHSHVACGNEEAAHGRRGLRTQRVATRRQRMEGGGFAFTRSVCTWHFCSVACISISCVAARRVFCRVVSSVFVRRALCGEKRSWCVGCLH